MTKSGFLFSEFFPSCRSTILTAALVLLLNPHGASDDWPQWRGPSRNGCSTETGLMQVWPEGGPPLLSKLSGLGTGYAGVAVSGGRIFTIGRHESDVFAIAMDEASGDPVWKYRIGESTRNPSSTPVVDNDRVYVLDPDGDLHCLLASNGTPVWQVSMIDDFQGHMMSSRGYGESPLIDGDQLVCTPGGKEAGMVALNKLNGALIWKSKLPDSGTAGNDGAAFSSIVVSEAAGHRQYVQLVGRGLIGMNAADGRLLWAYNDIANANANIPTPLVHEEYVFSANGYTAGSVLLKLAATPQNEAATVDSPVRAEIVYTLRGSQFQNHHGGFVHLGDSIYGGHGNNNGLPTCLEFSTGKIRWKRRGPGVGSAAVIYADNRLYFRYQDGVVALIDTAPDDYRLLGQFQIPGVAGDSWSHPAIANGRLYLREQDDLRVHDIRSVQQTPENPAEAHDSANMPLVKTLSRLGLSPVLSETPSELVLADESHAEKTPSDSLADMTLTIRFQNTHLTSDGLIRDEIIEQLRLCRFRIHAVFSGTRVGDSGLKQLPELRISELDLDLCPSITDAGFNELAGIDSLRSLVLSGTSVTHAGIQHLSGSRLVSLDLELCDGITDASCGPLSEIPGLKTLNLKKSGFERDRIGDDGLRTLSALKQLETLNLYGNSVTDEGLIHLQSFPKLQSVDLSLLALTDRGLIHLSSLISLQDLNLLYAEGFAGPKITNSGLTSIASMRSLQRLNLTGAKLSDPGLISLHTLQHLKSLQVVRTGISDQAVDALRKALPECRVEH
jgi:outer membrane protein assembly factor BamB